MTDPETVTVDRRLSRSARTFGVRAASCFGHGRNQGVQKAAPGKNGLLPHYRKQVRRTRGNLARVFRTDPYGCYRSETLALSKTVINGP